jgi:hypothetical protein
MPSMEEIDWKARAEAFEAALTPSCDTKYSYIGEIKIRTIMRDEDGDEHPHTLTMDWTDMKDFMKLILARADKDYAYSQRTDK